MWTTRRASLLLLWMIFSIFFSQSSSAQFVPTPAECIADLTDLCDSYGSNAQLINAGVGEFFYPPDTDLYTYYDCQANDWFTNVQYTSFIGVCKLVTQSDLSITNVSLDKQASTPLQTDSQNNPVIATTTPANANPPPAKGPDPVQ